MRFFLVEQCLQESSGVWPLPAEVSTHLRSLRFGADKPFCLVDPAGQAVIAHWDGIHHAIYQGWTELPPNPCVPVDLYTAWPKGKRAEQLVQRACEAGVRQIQPIVFERSVSGRKDLRPNQLQRLQRVSRETCQQLSHPYPPQVASQPISLEAALGRELTSTMARFALHPGDNALAEQAGATEQHEFSLLIGPEGGFSPTELEQITVAGWKRAGLLPTVLRIEAAGPWGAGLIQHRLMRSKP